MMRFRPVEWHESLPSTSLYLRQRLAAEPDLPSGTVIAAREQTAGRGQRGRSWITTPGRDLACSFLLRTEVDLTWIPSLSLVVSLGVAKALEDIGIAPTLKWPNDVLVGGRKISGVLIENIPARDGSNICLVGIGVNVNMDAETLARVGRPATSLRMETGRGIAIEAVLAGLLETLPEVVGAWEDGGFSAVRTAWTERARAVGRPVEVAFGRTVVRGTLVGLGEYGELLVREVGGAERRLWTGELRQAEDNPDAFPAGEAHAEGA